MPNLNVIETQILNVLRNQLIPWANTGASFVLLSAPPRMIGNNGISQHQGKKLPLQKGSVGKKIHAQFWREENLNAISVPYMGCVVDGEADITLGTTTAMCRELQMPGARWILQATEKTFFLAPPRHPISSGGGVHWERAHPEKAKSRIFWMQFYPTGVLCHFCSCEDGKHWSHPTHFIAGLETFAVARNIMREMTQQSPQYVPLVYFNLGILLNLIVRDILVINAQEQHELTSDLKSRSGMQDDVLRDAMAYIEQNLGSRLMTVEDIAQFIQLSPRHFSRLFKQERGMTVMNFVYKRRMELASKLLVESTFSIKKIGTSCGYVSAPPFIKAFIRQFDISPTQYRMQNKRNGRFD